MKRILLLVQILLLTIIVSTGTNEIDTNRREVPSLPAQAKDLPYYTQLTQSGKPLHERSLLGEEWKWFYTGRYFLLSSWCNW